MNAGRTLGVRQALAPHHVRKAKTERESGKYQNRSKSPGHLSFLLNARDERSGNL
jgi:hypothetical protein